MCTRLGAPCRTDGRLSHASVGGPLRGSFRDSCPAVDLAKRGPWPPTVPGFVLRHGSPHGALCAPPVPGTGPATHPQQKREEPAVCGHGPDDRDVDRRWVRTSRGGGLAERVLEKGGPPPPECTTGDGRSGTRRTGAGGRGRVRAPFRRPGGGSGERHPGEGAAATAVPSWGCRRQRWGRGPGAGTRRRPR